MKKADKSGARVALIWGEDEVASRSVTLKLMREESGSEERVEQKTIPISQLETALAAVLAS
jgi:histidyl-tRNA synthetase